MRGRFRELALALLLLAAVVQADEPVLKRRAVTGGGEAAAAPFDGERRIGISIGQSTPLGISADRSGAPVLVAGFWEASGAPIRPNRCTGDCNTDFVVTVDELIRGINIARGARLDSCAVFDADGDERVSVDELVEAVRNGLGGCPA